MLDFAEAVSKTSQLHAAKHYREAEVAYHNLLAEKPEEPVVLFGLGTLYSELKRHGLAITLLGKALERGLRPEYAPQALNNLASSMRAAGHREAAKRTFAKAIELAPEEGGYYGNWASCYINMGEPEEAERLCRRGLDLDPGNPHTEWNLALACLEQGKYREGWKYYKSGIRAGLRRNRHFGPEGTETPWWDGTSKVHTLCIYGEQGLGDEVMFATCFREILDKAENVVIDCTPRLKDTFARSFPEAEVYASDEDWHSGRVIDAKILMGDVAGLRRAGKEKFPRSPVRTLVTDQAKVDAMKDRLHALGDRPKLGVLWRGGTLETNLRERSFLPETLKPLLDLDCDFVSLQYTQGAEKAAGQMGIVHWQDAIDSIDDQLALIDALDGVVGCCGSAMHFTGALAKPGWVLAPRAVRWCYGQTGERMDWYPSLTVLRQPEYNDWESVIQEVKERVADHYGLHRAEPEALRVAG